MERSIEAQAMPMPEISETRQPNNGDKLEQLIFSSDLQSLARDIAAVRFEEGAIQTDWSTVGEAQAVMQTVFNFRKPGGERNDRDELPHKELFRDRVYDMAVQAGLAGDTVPVQPDADAAIVLGGRAMGAYDRTRYTKELLDSGDLQTDTVVLLGSSRPADDLDRAGWEGVGDAQDEYEIMQRAATEVFGAQFTDLDELQGYDDSVPHGFDNHWKITHAEANGRNIFVLSAPILTEPFYPDGNRRPRANTADTFRELSLVAGFGDNAHVVSVTNAHFRPFQGADAVAELDQYGMSAEVVGYDPAHYGRPAKEPEELLQETLSAVNSMRRAEQARIPQIKEEIVELEGLNRGRRWTVDTFWELSDDEVDDLEIKITATKREIRGLEADLQRAHFLTEQ